MGSENKNGKVPLISKIAYGFGDVGCNFSWMFVSNFLMIFYTDVFGISMAAVSALMLFLLAEILNFQGSAHLIGVGSLS